MRSSHLAAVGGAAMLVFAVAACGSSQAPGWTFQPAASVTPPPSTAASGEPSAAASASTSGEPSPGGDEPSAEPSGGGQPGQSGGTALSVVARGIAFEPKELQAPADTAFKIAFDNQDAGMPHDVDIRGTDGSVLADNQIVPTTGQMTYDIPALPAGEYQFICSVHPIPAMTGTLTVQ
jgi:plastocyanin